MSAIQYTVKAGDVLSTIAKVHYGNAHAYVAIAKHNHIPAPYTIRPGLTLELPSVLNGVKRLTTAPPNGTGAHPALAAATAGGANGAGGAGSAAHAAGHGSMHGMTKGQLRLDKAMVERVKSVPKKKLIEWLQVGRIRERDQTLHNHPMLPTFKSVKEFHEFMKAVEQVAWDTELYRSVPEYYTEDAYPAPGFEPVDRTGKKVTKDRFLGAISQ